MVRVSSCYLLAQLVCLPLALCGPTILSAHISRQGVPTNLTDLINQRSANHDAVPRHVLELLKNMGDKPPCHKAATHQLITLCQSTREDTLNPRLSIEDLEATKSIFAARVAICELREANANTPSQCKPLFILPSVYEKFSGQSQLSGNTCEQITNADLRACLRALEAKPQSWTSYSNSRQHATLLCDASRTEIMKDEALSLFHLLTALGYEISQALVDALQRATSQQEAEATFVEALRDLHMEQLQDLAKAHLENKAVFEKSGNQLAEAVHRVSDIIHSASVSAADLKQMVEAIFLSATAEGAELASIRIKDAEGNHEVAVALQEMIQDVTNNDFAILREVLSEVITAVDSVRDVIQSVHEDSTDLQAEVRDTSVTVKKTAQDLGSLQDATTTAMENARVFEAVTGQSQHKAMQLQETIDLLAEPLEGLSKFWQTLKVLGSKAVIFGEVAASMWVVANLFGRRYAQCVLLLYFIASRFDYTLWCHNMAIAAFYSMSAASWAADKMQRFQSLVVSNPTVFLSLTLVVMTVCAAMRYAKLRRREVKARRTRVIPLASPNALTTWPKNQTLAPAPYIPFNDDRCSHRGSERSRRAQTTPPRL